jgi:hypothetical protein
MSSMEPASKKHCTRTSSKKEWCIPEELEKEINFKCPFGTYLICQICLTHDPDKAGDVANKIKARKNFWYGNFTEHLKNSQRHKENVLRQQARDQDPSFKMKKQKGISDFFGKKNNAHVPVNDNREEQQIIPSSEEANSQSRIVSLRQNILPSTTNSQSRVVSFRQNILPSTKTCRGLLASQDLQAYNIQEGLKMISEYFASHIKENEKFILRLVPVSIGTKQVISIFGIHCEHDQNVK